MDEKGNLILCGFAASGKSTLGKAWAKQLGKLFIDTDLRIEEEVKKQKGKSLSCKEIYQTFGEEYFREVEKKIVKELAAIKDAVIATGGGTLLDSDSCRLLKTLGKVVYLRVDPEELKSRLLKRGIPAYLTQEEFSLSFDLHYQQRTPLYESAADVTYFFQCDSTTAVACDTFKESIFPDIGM